MGPVESAVRSRCTTGLVLRTPSGRGQFSIARIDDDGVVLLLGAKEAWTPLSWTCLEGVRDILAGGAWMSIAGKYDTTADAGTLDGYLKGCIKRATAGWVAAVLEHAEIVELDRRTPARVRLRADSTNRQR